MVQNKILGKIKTETLCYRYTVAFYTTIILIITCMNKITHAHYLFEEIIYNTFSQEILRELKSLYIDLIQNLLYIKIFTWRI